MAEGSLTAVDPGENAGLAFFAGGELVWCALANDDFEIRGAWSVPDHMVIEIPLYSDQTEGKDPQALIKLAIRAGQWLERIKPRVTRARRVYPGQWKGSVPKKIHNARVIGRLAPSEFARIPKLPESKLHNVIDAIGLGLFALGRMGRGA